MATNTSEIIGKINAIQTLIENFPMSLSSLFGGKKYTSVIEFVLDVLRQLGIDDIFITNKLIELIFNVPNAVECYQGVGNFTYHKIKKPTSEQIALAIATASCPTAATYTDPDYIYTETGKDESGNSIYTYYVKKNPLIDDELNSEFLTELEDALKPIIANIIAGILSCSVVPEIPDKYMDNASDTQKANLSVPLSVLDPYNLLDLSPTHEIGKNFYNVESDLTTNMLYRSNDLNAFIWYVMNRGIRIPESEENKMMWDSRIVAHKTGINDRDTSDKWNVWVNSRKNSPSGILTAEMMLYPSGSSANDALTNYQEGLTLYTSLHPIMQLERDGDITYGNERRLKVSISSQSFFKGKESTTTDPHFNKSIYEFNNEYLENIRILSPRVILTNMLEEILNGSLTANIGLKYSINNEIIEAKVNQIIKNVMEEDDTQVSDCYYSFSNDDFDEMLRQSELRKYNAKETNADGQPATVINSNVGTEALDSINSTATLNEKISTISKTVYDIAAIPAQDQQVSVSDSLTLNYNSNWITQIITAIVRPIVRSILSPQVMLLFLIDFNMMGLINIKTTEDLSGLMTILYRKLLSIFPSLIRYIKDKIVYFLMGLFWEYVEPLLLKMSIIILQEQLNDWIKLLEEALKCIPTFDFNKNKVLAQLDDVNYADIEQAQTVPEKNSSC